MCQCVCSHLFTYPKELSKSHFVEKPGRIRFPPSLCAPHLLSASLTHPLLTTLTWRTWWRSSDDDQRDQGRKSYQQKQHGGREAGPLA